MIVNYKNDGTYIDYEMNKNKITFADELMLNLEKYERDEENHIDICMDKSGNLVMGVIPELAEAYVAQIDIPARQYTTSEVENTDVSELEDDKITISTPIAFDVSKCTLTLWGLIV